MHVYCHYKIMIQTSFFHFQKLFPNSIVDWLLSGVNWEAAYSLAGSRGFWGYCGYWTMPRWTYCTCQKHRGNNITVKNIAVNNSLLPNAYGFADCEEVKVVTWLGIVMWQETENDWGIVSSSIVMRIDCGGGYESPPRTLHLKVFGSRSLIFNMFKWYI